jgi:Acetyltransferase (GNAT) domain
MTSLRRKKYLRESPIFEKFRLDWDMTHTFNQTNQYWRCPHSPSHFHFKRHGQIYCTSPTFAFNLPFLESEEPLNCLSANRIWRTYSPKIKPTIGLKTFNSSHRLVVNLSDFFSQERVSARTRHSWKRWNQLSYIQMKIYQSGDPHIEELLNIHLQNLQIRFKDKMFFESEEMIRLLKYIPLIRIFVIEENGNQVSSVIFIESEKKDSVYMASLAFSSSNLITKKSPGLYALVSALEHYKDRGIKQVDLGTPAQKYKHKLSTHCYETLEMCNPRPKLQAYLIQKLYLIWKHNIVNTLDILR